MWANPVRPNPSVNADAQRRPAALRPPWVGAGYLQRWESAIAFKRNYTVT